jgi:aquaporin Z
VGGWALAQLWLFWVAPLVGAALAGVAYSVLAEDGVPFGEVPEERAARERYEREHQHA